MIADLIALAALGVSLWTFFWSRRAERRIRAVSDSRGAFDAWLLTPIEAHLASLSQVLGEMVLVLRENENPEDRDAETRRIQRGKFSTWCIDVLAFCDSQADAVCADLQIETSNLIDLVSDRMNDLSADAPQDVADEIAKALIAAKHSYVAKVRAELQAARLAVN